MVFGIAPAGRAPPRWRVDGRRHRHYGGRLAHGPRHVEDRTDLHRAIKNGTFTDDLFVVDDEPVAGLLHPRFEATTYVDGSGREQVSNADVTVYPLSSGDEVGTGGGTSMFDVDGWFGFTHWKYFKVTGGTEYPENLVIKRGRSRRTNKAGNRTGYHYQIEPRNRMTVAACKGALDNFARSAIARTVALAKGH